MSSTNTFAKDARYEADRDTPKRLNDDLITDRVIIPFLTKQNDPYLNAVSMPGISLTWEWALRRDRALRHVPMSFNLVEYDKAAHKGLVHNVQEIADKASKALDNIVDGDPKEMLQLSVCEQPQPVADFLAALHPTTTPCNLVYLDYLCHWDNHVIDAMTHTWTNSDAFADSFLLGVTIELNPRDPAGEACKRALDIADIVNVPDGCELEYCGGLKNKETATQLKYGIGGANMVKAMFEEQFEYSATLKFARVYKRALESGRGNHMLTLWFEIEK